MPSCHAALRRCCDNDKFMAFKLVCRVGKKGGKFWIYEGLKKIHTGDYEKQRLSNAREKAGKCCCAAVPLYWLTFFQLRWTTAMYFTRKAAKMQNASEDNHFVELTFDSKAWVCSCLANITYYKASELLSRIYRKVGNPHLRLFVSFLSVAHFKLCKSILF